MAMRLMAAMAVAGAVLGVFNGAQAQEGKMAAKVAPYGAWASPITAEGIAEGQVAVSGLTVADGKAYWLESRPSEGGRMVVMTGDAADAHILTPQGFNVRTRVHEYGGAPYAVIGGDLYFSNFDDQRLYRQAPGAAPEALTPQGYRYADCVGAPGGGLVCVRQDHTDPKDVRNTIVALSAKPGDAGRVLFGKTDFVAYPRLSPDGRRLAWIAWDHPNMPWDATSLHVADFGAEGLSNDQVVAGGEGQSVVEPQWGADGTLYFSSDATDFWNLRSWRGGEAKPIAPRAAEFARSLWQLGQANYAVLSGGRILARYGEAGHDHLEVIDVKDGAAHQLANPFVEVEDVKLLDPGHAMMIVRSTDKPAAIVSLDLASSQFGLVRRPSPAQTPERYISHAEAIDFPTTGGLTAHALFYPPRNGDFRAPDGARPPLIVQVHGGPTSQASPSLSLATQYWTSRGFAVVDVDHGGSSGYGRKYRQRLNGKWGVVDVEDVVAAARYLVSAGKVDPARVAIHGGSAGGYTVLNALSRTDVFKAGADYYGISDLSALARDTHKFESRYLDNLVGPWPAAKAVYEERSALNHLDGFKAPLIVFQGADDPVVPPNQAHMIVDALRKRGAPVAYLEFPGEGHGFRKPENTIRAEKAELYFYGRVFGFTPADALEPVKIENLPGG
jgi:dipeptidyl aminopeptidase/acylaminoacyl peptidase